MLSLKAVNQLLLQTVLQRIPDKTKQQINNHSALLLPLKGNLIMSLFSSSRRISLLFGHYDETLPHYNLAYIKLTQGPRDHSQTALTHKLNFGTLKLILELYSTKLKTCPKV